VSPHRSRISIGPLPYQTRIFSLSFLFAAYNAATRCPHHQAQRETTQETTRHGDCSSGGAVCITSHVACLQQPTLKERVSRSHRTGVSGPFEDAAPRILIEEKVRKHLEGSGALQAVRNTLITGARRATPRTRPRSSAPFGLSFGRPTPGWRSGTRWRDCDQPEPRGGEPDTPGPQTGPAAFAER